MLTKTPKTLIADEHSLGATAIPPPRFEVIEVKLHGTAPYMQARFAQKSINMMREKHEAGHAARKGKKREARDFKADFEGAKHVSTEGWCGIPAGAFRKGCISACRLVGFKMTLAKLSLFVEADGFDRVDGTPLIRIYGTSKLDPSKKCEPEVSEMPVRNATGVIDIRARPLWREWWILLRLRYDLDQFSRTDVINLLSRVGQQVGVGEGRPDSKNSDGIGFGLFQSEE